MLCYFKEEHGARANLLIHALILPDAVIVAEIGGSDEIYGHRFRSNRYDCGSKSGYLWATVAVEFGCGELHDDLYNCM